MPAVSTCNLQVKLIIPVLFNKLMLLKDDINESRVLVTYVMSKKQLPSGQQLMTNVFELSRTLQNKSSKPIKKKHLTKQNCSGRGSKTWQMLCSFQQQNEQPDSGNDGQGLKSINRDNRKQFTIYASCFKARAGIDYAVKHKRINELLPSNPTFTTPIMYYNKSNWLSHQSPVIRITVSSKLL